MTKRSCIRILEIVTLRRGKATYIKNVLSPLCNRSVGSLSEMPSFSHRIGISVKVEEKERFEYLCQLCKTMEVQMGTVSRFKWLDKVDEVGTFCNLKILIFGLSSIK